MHPVSGGLHLMLGLLFDGSHLLGVTDFTAGLGDIGMRVLDAVRRRIDR